MSELQEVARQVHSCTDCHLSQGRTQAVPGEGPEQAELMFIGEGPGYNEDMQGRSMVPLLAGRSTDNWRKSFYYHYYEYPGVHDVRRHYGVRTDRHKLIHYYNLGEWELFDLAKDPNELKSVYDYPARRVEERLREVEV